MVRWLNVNPHLLTWSQYFTFTAQKMMWIWTSQFNITVLPCFTQGNVNQHQKGKCLVIKCSSSNVVSRCLLFPWWIWASTVHCKLIKDGKYFCAEVCTSYKYNGLKKKTSVCIFYFYISLGVESLLNSSCKDPVSSFSQFVFMWIKYV